MREMWQLPKKSLRSRAWLILKVVTITWAITAVPITVWLSGRTTPPPPLPPQRTLTAVDTAAVRYASQSLLSQPVTLTETVVTPLAQLRVEQTADIGRNVRHGVVRSGTQTAEMLAVGDRVLLRGPAPFWASLGVPTAEPGWVEVNDRLGASLLFPLAQAAAALAPGPQALMDNTADTSAPATYRNGSLTAVITGDGITTVTLGNRTAAITRPTGDSLSKLAASPPPGWDAGFASLIGTGGALTVAPAGPPPPPGEAPPTPAPAPAQ